MAQNGVEKELTPQQHKGLAALLVSKNVREASRASGVPERSLHRWLADSRFMLALTAAEGQAVDHATRRLIALVNPSLDALEAALVDAEAPHAIKVRAGGVVLDAMLKMRELRNVESRLASLEAVLNGKPNDN